MVAIFFVVTWWANNVVTSVAIRGASPDVTLQTQVGRDFDERSIERDVRELWALGRFEDIRVETARHEGGTAVVFQLAPSPLIRLHEVRVAPTSYSLRIQAPEGTPLNRMRAEQLAAQAREQLEAHGYLNPRVDWSVAPLANGLADLKLTVRAEDPVRVSGVRFSGDTALEEKDLRRELRALHARRILFWKLAPSYSDRAVNADLARITSLYLSKGYFDVTARAEEPEFYRDRASVSIAIDAGRRTEIRNPISCGDLLARRREAQTQGILDFSVRGEIAGDELRTSIERGPAYRVRRINFSGSGHFRDAAIRRTFVLDEAAPLDEFKLRKSIARLNRLNYFQPVDVKDVAIATLGETADVNVRLTERKAGRWSLSGPVGTPSFAGSLQAALTERVPWMPSFVASATVVALHPPLYGLIPVKNFIPVAAVERPFNGGLWSGFIVAPQLGWPVTAITYGATQLRERLTPVLQGSRGLVTELPVTIETRTGEKVLYCEPGNPRWWPVRAAAIAGLQIIGALPAL